MFGNLNDIVLDEIALEGLDGITVEGSILYTFILKCKLQKHVF